MKWKAKNGVNAKRAGPNSMCSRPSDPHTEIPSTTTTPSQLLPVNRACQACISFTLHFGHYEYSAWSLNVTQLSRNNNGALSLRTSGHRLRWANECCCLDLITLYNKCLDGNGSLRIQSAWHHFLLHAIRQLRVRPELYILKPNRRSEIVHPVSADKKRIKDNTLKHE